MVHEWEPSANPMAVLNDTRNDGQYLAVSQSPIAQAVTCGSKGVLDKVRYERNRKPVK